MLYTSASSSASTASRDTAADGAHFSLYGSSAKDKKGKGKAVQEDTANGAEEETPLQRRQSERMYALPTDGGPFKGFAFAVLRDADRAKAACERWNWDDRGKAKAGPVKQEEEMADDDDDDEEENEVGNEIEDDDITGGSGDTKQDEEGVTEQPVADGSEVPDASVEPSSVAKKEKPKAPVLPAAERADRSGFRMMPM